MGWKPLEVRWCSEKIRNGVEVTTASRGFLALLGRHRPVVVSRVARRLAAVIFHESQGQMARCQAATVLEWNGDWMNR